MFIKTMLICRRSAGMMFSTCRIFSLLCFYVLTKHMAKANENRWAFTARGSASLEKLKFLINDEKEKEKSGHYQSQ